MEWLACISSIEYLAELGAKTSTLEVCPTLKKRLLEKLNAFSASLPRLPQITRRRDVWNVGRARPELLVVMREDCRAKVAVPIIVIEVDVLPAFAGTRGTVPEFVGKGQPMSHEGELNARARAKGTENRVDVIAVGGQAATPYSSRDGGIPVGVAKPERRQEGVVCIRGVKDANLPRLNVNLKIEQLLVL